MAPNQDLGYYLGIYAMLGVLALTFLVISCWSVKKHPTLWGFIADTSLQANDHHHGSKVW